MATPSVQDARRRRRKSLRQSPSGPYVLQVKLRPAERRTVAKASRANTLPMATWARQALLRAAAEDQARARRRARA